ncbi:ketopantoate reductase family protein [Gordonia sp. DT30]|uniref:ketopantoate reductase family protein n=1 Tax=Gordonia sp. DT30 TaxID=3416546 RepID=UPI003CEE5190
MHFVIYGAGAIGGVVGAHLHASGIPTTLVARGAHLAAMREHGLVLDTAGGRHAHRIPLAANASEVEWTEDTVVLLTVKSQQTAAALDDLRTSAPPSTPIVSAQNGVANEPAILRRFARTYSVCVMLPALHLEPGVVVQGSSAHPGILDVGRFPDGVDALSTSLASCFAAAGFPSEARPQIMAWKYRKLIMNLANGIDACFRDDSAAHRELVSRARAEGEAVLAAAGIEAVSSETDRQRRGDLIVRRPTGEDGSGSSTWQSVERGTGSVEIDYLTGEIVLLGRLHGVGTPVNELVQAETMRLVRDRLPAGSLDPAAAVTRLAQA